MSNVSSCPSSVKPCRRRSKVGYRVRNWPDYDAGLQQRGSLTCGSRPKRSKRGIIKGRPNGGPNIPFRMVPSKRR